MSLISEQDRTFVFTPRPKPVPGDLRIAWRLPVTLLGLMHSRGQRASFAKMHVLNDALRSPHSREKLAAIFSGATPAIHWRTRVEPAFSRNLDFMVGEGLLGWTVVQERTGVILTEQGRLAAKAVHALPTDILAKEREFLEAHAKKITEAFVRELLAAGKRLL